MFSTPNIHAFIQHPEKNTYENVPLLESSRILLEKWQDAKAKYEGWLK